MPTGRRPWNPFRSEAEAYQFLIVVVAYFAAIVLASVLGGRWAGLAVFITLTAAGGAWVLLRDRAPAPQQQTPVRQEDGTKRILVVANETAAARRRRRRPPALRGPDHARGRRPRGRRSRRALLSQTSLCQSTARRGMTRARPGPGPSQTPALLACDRGHVRRDRVDLPLRQLAL